MTHDELRRRIRMMPYEAIMLLTGKDMWKLTDGFDEELVKEIVAKQRTPKGQMDAIRNMKNAHFMALQTLQKPIISPPEYFEDWIFDIKTGVLVEVPTPKDEAVAIGSKLINDVADKFREFNAEKAQLQSRIDKLEAENKALREKQTIPEEADEQEEKEQEDVLYNKVSFECFLRLLEKAGFDINNTGNKSRAGELWHMLTGKSADDLRKFCSSRAYNNSHTKEDIKRLNAKLEEMGISEIKL